jgi:ubiquinone/menaquinone biosynthesis C-methylase UbiE
LLDRIDQSRSNSLALAHTYEEARRLPPCTMSMWREELAAHLTPCHRLLDVGAGTGRFRPILETLAGRSIIELDIAAEMLLYLRQESSRYRSLKVVGAAEQLPFANASFSHVFASAVMHHLDISRAMGEFARVLSEGGRLLIRGTLRDDLDSHPLQRWFPGWRVIEENALYSNGNIERVALRYQLQVTATRRILEVVANNVAEYIAKVALKGTYSLRQLEERDFQAGLEAMRRDINSEGSGIEIRVPVSLLVLQRRPQVYLIRDPCSNINQ